MLKKNTMALAVLAALHAFPAFAAEQPEADAAEGSSRAQVLDTVSVIGLGETRQVQRLSPERIAALPPGTSPLKLLADLPGVNFQSADAFGAFGNRGQYMVVIPSRRLVIVRQGYDDAAERQQDRHQAGPRRQHHHTGEHQASVVGI